MKLYNSIKKRVDRLIRVEFDKSTGFYRYRRFGKYVYIRFPKHMDKESDLVWSCEKLFFKHYFPKNDDLVVDLGAGYGGEALYVAQKSPNVRYIGVEAQPVIFECLANTFRQAGDGFVASPYAITGADSVKFVSHYSYAAVGGIPQGYIEVPTMKWEDFLQKYGIHRIDLLKMNIEGAEKDIVLGIKDFSIIRRFIISCHDFRADNGDGEWYRTREAVISTLEANGYTIKRNNYGISFADDWIYAERLD